MFANDSIHCCVSLPHMHIAIAVVAHETDGVLPIAGVNVIGIVDDFVDHDLSLSLSTCRQTAYAHVGAVALGQVGTLAFIEHTEEVIADVAHGLAERVLTLVAEQIVIGRRLPPVAGKHTIVPGTIAHEQQVARHVGLALGAIVEHLQVASIGVGVGRATAELVEELVGRYDAHTQRVKPFMQCLQTLGLRQQLLCRGDNDDQIDGSVGMMILVGNAIYILRHGEGVAAELRRWSRCGHGQRQVVGAHGGVARCLTEAYRILCLQQPVEGEHLCLLHGFRLRCQIIGDADGANKAIVHHDADLGRAIAGEDDREIAAVGMGR